MARQPVDRFHSGWHRTVRFICQRMLFGTLLSAEVKVSIEGKKNIKELSGPFILVANHSSHLDSPLIVAKLPYKLTRNLAQSVAADYWYKSKWKSTFASFFVNSYPVERVGRSAGKGGRKKPGLSVSLLRSGIPLCIFPEGTRSRDGVMKKFTPGAAGLARSLRVPVVPVAIVGAHDAMPVGTNWPKPGRPEVTLLIGEPLRAHAGEPLADFNARVEAQVRAMHESRSPFVRAGGLEAEELDAETDQPAGTAADGEPANDQSPTLSTTHDGEAGGAQANSSQRGVAKGENVDKRDDGLQEEAS